MLNSIGSFLFKCLLVFGLFLGIQEAVNGYIENRAFKDYGKVAETEQIHKIEQSVETIKKRRSKEEVRITNEAVINFTTADDKKISIKKKLPDDIIERYKKFQQVDIEYLNNEPENTRWIGQKRNVRASIGFSFAMLVLLFFTFYFGRQKMTEEDLLT